MTRSKTPISSNRKSLITRRTALWTRDRRLATILFTVTLLAMGLTVLQQRRAERMASVRPDQEEA